MPSRGEQVWVQGTRVKKSGLHESVGRQRFFNHQSGSCSGCFSAQLIHRNDTLLEDLADVKENEHTTFAPESCAVPKC